MTTSTPEPMRDPHATHDRLLIAARAAGDLGGRDLARADAILSACESCRILLAELRSIETATRRLAPPDRPASLDFRLTRDQAARLARGRLWRRALRPFGAMGSPIVRPAAMAFTTLGLVGLLVASLPLIQASGGAAVLSGAGGALDSQSFRATTQAREAASPGIAALPLEPGAVASPSAPPASPPAEAPDDQRSSAGADRLQAPPGPPEGGGPPPLVVVSAVFLALGIGLALLRRTALRLR